MKKWILILACLAACGGCREEPTALELTQQVYGDATGEVWFERFDNTVNLQRRRTAVLAAANLGEEVLPLVEVGLQDERWSVRWSSARVVAEIVRKQEIGTEALQRYAIPGLIDNLSHENSGVRWVSVDALTVIGPGALDALPALRAAEQVEPELYRSEKIASAIKAIEGPFSEP